MAQPIVNTQSKHIINNSDSQEKPENSNNKNQITIYDKSNVLPKDINKFDNDSNEKNKTSIQAEINNIKEKVNSQPKYEDEKYADEVSKNKINKSTQVPIKKSRKAIEAEAKKLIPWESAPEAFPYFVRQYGNKFSKLLYELINMNSSMNSKDDHIKQKIKANALEEKITNHKVKILYICNYFEKLVNKDIVIEFKKEILNISEKISNDFIINDYGYLENDNFELNEIYVMANLHYHRLIDNFKKELTEFSDKYKNTIKLIKENNNKLNDNYKFELDKDFDINTIPADAYNALAACSVILGEQLDQAANELSTIIKDSGGLHLFLIKNYPDIFGLDALE
jgi:hypothetical protein